jgi:hypothetical protein
MQALKLTRFATGISKPQSKAGAAARRIVYCVGAGTVVALGRGSRVGQGEANGNGEKKNRGLHGGDVG